MLDARFGGPFQNHEAGADLGKLLHDGLDEFDSENPQHLLTLYNHLARLLRTDPSFYGRVIGGMVWVIMNEANQILDPESDCIDLHPRFQQMADRATKMEGLLLWSLYHQQGGKSEVGQPIRRLLGIEQHAELTPAQIDQAHAAACKGGCETFIGIRQTGSVQCADCSRKPGGAA
ncbi:hypothetical protein K8U54_19045 [Pseudomonas fulva]|uniref:hypothetical protein n=1 Tax=Pseudomonas fulva TaxID=47880 RepID=UPI00201DE772|nr:hypothetical protein [Pseudomonas fulva]UQY33788.1 hypothetical protein K8U54_19045 [Pseudomonas fulva]